MCMTKNKINHIKDNIIYLGASARCARRRAFRCNSAGVGHGAHGRGQELPPVALPLPVPQSPRLCGVYASIPGAE